MAVAAKKSDKKSKNINKSKTSGRGGSRPGAGRPKGSANKRTQEVIEKLEALGCDPIVGMAKIAMDKNADLQLRGSMYKELAQYVYPKRKAVEVSGTGEGGAITLVMHGVDDED